MLKKLLCFCITHVSISFCFWEMEGPFIAQATTRKLNNAGRKVIVPCPSLGFKKYLYDPKYRIQEYFPKVHKQIQYIVFLYDQNSNYIFSLLPSNNLNTLKNNLLFLQNKNTTFENKEFFTEIKQLSTNPKKSILYSGVFAFSLFNNSLHSQNTFNLQPNFTAFSLNQNITTDSRITITNPNFDELENTKVFPTITKSDQPILFQNALKKYFDQDSHYTAMATAITQNKHPFSNQSFVYNIGKVANKITQVGEKEVDRLNNCTILTIYTVTKGEDNKNSVVCGLAQDNTTPEKRKFFYVTYLENNISALIN